MGKILGEARVRYKSQITFPKTAVEYFDLKIGDRLSFVEENGQLIIKRVKTVHEDLKSKK